MRRAAYIASSYRYSDVGSAPIQMVRVRGRGVGVGVGMVVAVAVGATVAVDAGSGVAGLGVAGVGPHAASSTQRHRLSPHSVGYRFDILHLLRFLWVSVQNGWWSRMHSVGRRCKLISCLSLSIPGRFFYVIARAMPPSTSSVTPVM
jgi:hypothetical protein